MEAEGADRPAPAAAAPGAIPDALPDALPAAIPGAIPAGPELRTERFRLRPLIPADAEAIHRLVNDWAVVRMLSRLPFPYPRALTDEWIASTEVEREAGRAWHFAILDPGEPAAGVAAASGPARLLGCLGLRVDPAARTADLGYWIGAKFWNNGVAAECAGRVSRWALANLPVDRLSAEVATDNPASAAVLRRIGFRETGRGRQSFLARGGDHPVLLFEATHDDLSPLQDLPPAPEPAAGATAAAEPPRRILLVAACALIDPAGRVLLARRPEGKSMAGLWEFPGGKVEPGETPEQALVRELREEIDVELDDSCLAPFAFSSHPYRTFHLLMPLFLCRRWRGEPRGRENQALAWVPPAELDRYAVPDADKPLIPLLRDYL